MASRDLAPREPWSVALLVGWSGGTGKRKVLDDPEFIHLMGNGHGRPP